ncbi:MAG: hypothetical protein P1U38_09725 [Aeromicrobium sp.]|uniref:hypothetical protein n=1 Tax=Aeromicrobium sp. TaxID=1871063 RepID=UPI00261AC1EE|nr:hypothetical protein [Aeromicrobium sp.]MDF1705040.1 hypothetical protein [Aeromicrobium sp.]
MSSDALRTINHVPPHPRWCSENVDCSDFTLDPMSYAEHKSDTASFVPASTDVRLHVGTVRVDTTTSDTDREVEVEVGWTEVRLAISGLGRCDCSRPHPEASVILGRADVKHLMNLLTTHEELAWARQFLDLREIDG